MKIRINKYLASVGVASRRKIDELIGQGRILVNNIPATPGYQVDPEIDQILVDSKHIKPIKPKFVYYLLNKPAGYLSTCSDEQDRETVLDLVPQDQRVFPVGRLDCQTSGLIILTNDGDLALKLTHPRYHLPKTYRITTPGNVPSEKIAKLAKPIMLEEGPTLPSIIDRVSHTDYKTIIDLTIFEGKNRQVRRMCEGLGLKIDALNRVAIGPVSLGNLKVGNYRILTPEEVSQLRQD